MEVARPDGAKHREMKAGRLPAPVAHRDVVPPARFM
jgi:hypothetical protein